MNKPSVLRVLAVLILLVRPLAAATTNLDDLAWETKPNAVDRPFAVPPGAVAIRDNDTHRSFRGGTLLAQPVQSWRFTLGAADHPPRLAIRFDPGANDAAYTNFRRLLTDQYGAPYEFENAARRDALWILGPSSVLAGQTRHALLTALSGRDAHVELLFFEQPTPPANAARSHLRYTLRRDPHPTPAQLDAYRHITEAMDGAVRFYERFTVGIVKTDTVFLDPAEATAEGNINGNIQFGPTDISLRTALHEMSHTVGVGTTPAYHRLTVNERFIGKHALAQLRAITGDDHAILHADTWHFWPYGLNNPGEDLSIWDYIYHCQMVSAILQDCREAR